MAYRHRPTIRDRRPALPPDRPPAAHPDDFDFDGHFAVGGPVRRRKHRKPARELRATGGKSKPRADRRPRSIGGAIGALARGLSGIVGEAELSEAAPAVAWAAGAGVRHAVKKRRKDDDDDGD